MAQARRTIGLLILFVWASGALAQSGDRSIKIYGYLQNSFQHWTAFDSETTHPQLSTPEQHQIRLCPVYGQWSQSQYGEG
jgi:hypothetical protein